MTETSDKLISIKKLEQMIEQGIPCPNLIRKINPHTYSYKQAATIEGGLAATVKAYTDRIIANYSVEKKPNTVNESTNRTIRKQVANKDRYRRNTNKNRIKTIKSLIRCNINELDSFFTLTLGDRDYSELIKNKIKKHPSLRCKFNTLELNKLVDIKNISTCDNDSDSKLNKSDSKLRLKVRNILGKVTGKKQRVIEKLSGQKSKYSTKFFNRKVNRELCQQLNSLIFNGDNPLSIDDANDEFRYFIDRIKENIKKNFKYILVIEIQKESQKPHFHLLCNLPYIEQWDLQTEWNNGIVDIRKVNSIKNELNINENDSMKIRENKVINYFIEQIEKTSEDSRMENRQIFRASNNLRRPMKITTATEINILNKYINDKNLTWCNDGKLIESKNEYGKDFYIKKYKLDNFKLYYLLNNMSKKLLIQMVNVAKKQEQDYIYQNNFDNVISNSYFKNDYKKAT